MAKLRRTAVAALADDAALRLRAAWLYHGFGLTQTDVADQLGLGRSTVVRLLEDARARGEVKITIADESSARMELAVNLERAMGLDEVVIVPAPDGEENTRRAVGLALGAFLAETVADDMTIGVGWGRTLTAALDSFTPPRRSGVRVMSLMGGAVETAFANPFEFAWRLAAVLNAECFLFPAPLVVDSAETKRRLIEDCGLHRLIAMASSLDVAVVSAGDIAADQGSLVRRFITERDVAELLSLGCVADVMCNFIDAGGQPVPHEINMRSMSVGLGILMTARHKVLASGGRSRAPAILAAARSLRCNTLITDEHAAAALFDLAAG